VRKNRLWILSPPSQGAQPSLVFHDATASIFALPQSAPYAQTADAGCRIDIISRQDIQTVCPTATVLTRRELFFPGWSATVGNAPVAVLQAGLFETVHVPAGTADVRFSYAPPHIRLACILAVLALALWLGLVFRSRRIGMRLRFKSSDEFLMAR
jgi:hypothetical protein